MVKNLPCIAGDTGSIPGWGTKIPHTTGRLSLSATITEKPVYHKSKTKKKKKKKKKANTLGKVPFEGPGSQPLN